MPGMGHANADLAGPEVRFWPLHSYLIIYRDDVRPIHVLRVVSGERNLFVLLRRS
jgi:plasmid stabilization system protein ParE